MCTTDAAQEKTTVLRPLRNTLRSAHHRTARARTIDSMVEPACVSA